MVNSDASESALRLLIRVLGGRVGIVYVRCTNGLYDVRRSACEAVLTIFTSLVAKGAHTQNNNQSTTPTSRATHTRARAHTHTRTHTHTSTTSTATLIHHHHHCRCCQKDEWGGGYAGAWPQGVSRSSRPLEIACSWGTRLEGMGQHGPACGWGTHLEGAPDQQDLSRAGQCESLYGAKQPSTMSAPYQHHVSTMSAVRKPNAAPSNRSWQRQYAMAYAAL